MPFLDLARRAFAQGVRWMLRRPLASLSAATCLGVGMAASAVALTLVDAAILRPFGLAESDRLVVIWETDTAGGQPLIEVSHLNFLDWQRESRTLEQMAAMGSSDWPALAHLGTGTVPLAARAVSSSFFATVGIRPAYGRDFQAADLTPDVIPPVMLSHRLWRSRFGAAPSVIGESMFIDGEDHRIIGVMPAGFGYPDDPDVWISVERALDAAFQNVPLDAQRFIGVLEVLGKRRRETSNDEVRRELSGIIQHLRIRQGAPKSSMSAVVTPFSEVLLGRLGARLWIALAMAAAVLLFACANVAAVRLAQARERALELTARLFLGATRRRLGAELTVEATPLVLAGFGVSLAVWLGVVAIVSRAPAVIESGLVLTEHRGAAAVTLPLLALISWVLVGVLPALVSSRVELVEAQRVTSRLTLRPARIGAPLLVAQAAIAIAVVAIAGVALQAFNRLSRIDLGFATRGVTLVDIGVPGWKYPTSADQRRLVHELHGALSGIATVERVAAVSLRPFRFGEIADGLPVRRSDQPLVQPDDAIAAGRVVVTTEYFAALGQPIVQGRSFGAFDRSDTEPVAIISRTLARALWGAESATGKRVETFTLSEQWRSRLVVGVAGDARSRGLERPSMELYVPDTQSQTPLGSFVLRSSSPESVTETVVRQAFGRVEPEIAIERVQTTTDLRQSVLNPARLLAVLMSLLAGAGLLLLALGVFGAAATALAVAWPEIAVRQAVGAMPVQAALAPLGLLGRSLAVGIGGGLLLTPAALSSVNALGLGVGESIVVPLVAGGLTVITAAAGAAAPALYRASRMSPADLLRPN